MSIQVPLKWFREYEGGPLELHIARFTWDTALPATGRLLSRKLSFKLQIVPQDLWIGIFWKREGFDSTTWWLCLLPCLPIRIKLKRSFGGRFP